MILENHQTTSYLRHDDYIYIYTYTYTGLCILYICIHRLQACFNILERCFCNIAVLHNFLNADTFSTWQSVHGRRSNMSDPPNNSVWPWGLFNEMNDNPLKVPLLRPLKTAGWKRTLRIRDVLAQKLQQKMCLVGMACIHDHSTTDTSLKSVQRWKHGVSST